MTQEQIQYLEILAQKKENGEITPDQFLYYKEKVLLGQFMDITQLDNPVNPQHNTNVGDKNAQSTSSHQAENIISSSLPSLSATRQVLQYIRHRPALFFTCLALSYVLFFIFGFYIARNNARQQLYVREQRIRDSAEMSISQIRRDLSISFQLRLDSIVSEQMYRYRNSAEGKKATAIQAESDNPAAYIQTYAEFHSPFIGRDYVRYIITNMASFTSYQINSAELLSYNAYGQVVSSDTLFNVGAVRANSSLSGETYWKKPRIAEIIKIRVLTVSALP